MTKYILHGGAAHTPNAGNDAFFKEILKDAPDQVAILLVHFASLPGKLISNREKDTDLFERARGRKKLSFEEATPESFPGQAARANVIYFGGGTTVRLLQVMRQFSDLAELFTGKTIAGESAGANFLCKYCYSKSGGGVIEGMGIIPIKLISHYDGTHKQDLEAVPEKLEIVMLPESQFKVVRL